MSESIHNEIEATIARLKRRSLFVTFVRAELRWLFYGYLMLAIGVAVWLALPFAGLVIAQSPREFPIVAFALATAGIATIAALLQCWFERPASISVAKAWDDASGGKDRLASAIQLRSTSTPMGRALLDEAAETSRRVAPARVFPVRVPREGWFLPAPVVAAALLSLLPAWLNAGPAPDPALLEALHNQAANIKNFVSREKAKEITQPRREMLERLERIAADLSNDKMRKKDALAELAKLMEDMRRDKEDQEKKKLDLEKLLKNFQTNDKNRELTDELNQGKYDDAANRIEKMLDQLKEDMKKKKDELKKEDMDKLENKMKELQNVKANLMKMLKVNMNIKNAKEIMEFLEMSEGELGELADEEVIDGKAGKCMKPCSRPAAGPIVRMSERFRMKTSKAGRGTMTNFLGDEETHTANQREEHKITIREQKGKSAFSQTQVANDGSRSKLAAKEVLESEKHAAEDTIERQDIPAGYRDYLRKYFDGIQPDNAGDADAKSAKSGAVKKATNTAK